MKNKVIGVIGLFLVAILAIGFSAEARKQSFEESFLFEGNAAEAKSGSYKFDVAHSAIGFKVKHMGLVDVPGYFTKFDGDVNYDANDVTKSSVNFKIDAASVDTRNERRDGHLRSKDFFTVEKFPTITFKSKKVVKKGDLLNVTGDFTMMGKTKEITIPVKVVGFKEGRRGTVMGATAKTSIKRSEFGITYGIANGAIGDEVKIEINVEARGK